MPEIAVQPSFSGGEWSPNLYSRVDITKYRSAAALLENWFVDYRNGASTRSGTQYVLQAYDSANPVRVITYQASFSVGYAVEIGNGYMRFHYRGAPIVENSFAISGATKANPCVLTIVGNNYAIGDWIYVASVAGMTQLNGRYFKVLNVAGNAVTLGYLTGANIDSTAYSTYTSGGTAARVYTLPSPYTNADDLRQIKFAQSVNQMVLCHPNHGAYVLSSISANNWTLVAATFGATVATPGAPTVTTSLGAGSVNYSYGVTAIDNNGQESQMSSPTALASKVDIRLLSTTAGGSNTVSWAAVSGAVAYNVYEAAFVYGAAVPAGVQYGFVGTVQGTTFVDTNVGQDFTICPPIAQNPFTGYGVASVAVTAPGTYTTIPNVTFTGASSAPATAVATLSATAVTRATNGSGYSPGDTITYPNGVVIQVTTIGGGGGAVTGHTVLNAGSTSTNPPANPNTQVSTSGSGTGCTVNITWGVATVIVTYAGYGYAAAPTVGFSSGAASATASLTPTPVNPTVPGFIQQRLFLGAPTNSPASFWLSQPGQYFNLNTSLPVQANNAISGTLVSGTLNTIKSVVGTAAGGLVLTDKAIWLLNGGSNGSAVSATAIVANPQSYVGASDVPPIVANYDVLYIQSKGSAVRAATYSVYQQVFTGADVSVQSSHLFYDHIIQEMCWAEQPFYSAQLIRDDGVILALTYMKDQEYIGWSHYTTNGLFKSICAVTETDPDDGVVFDTVYTVVQRVVNGNTVKYIECFAERSFPTGYNSAWCVDTGLQYSGSPATTFTGAEHLAGMTVTGLADGAVITPFVMPTNGIFTLGAAASLVTIGLAYNCNLQTLPLDIGEPSVQGKVKKIVSVDIRVVDTLGLKIGSSASTLVAMKDLVIGNVSSALTGQPTQVVSGLVTGDAKTILDPTYTVPGQYYIRQDQPYPATIAGVFPRFEGEARNER